jgi:hypothetical protein
MPHLATGVRAACLSGLSLAAAACLGQSAQTVARPLPAAASAPASAPACSFCTRTTFPPTCTLCLQRNPLLTAEADGTASGVLQLCNDTASGLTPALRMSDFAATPPGRQAFALGTVALSAADASQQDIVKGAAPLAPKACIGLKVEATGLLQPGVMSAQLADGDRPLAELKAVRKNFDFRLVAEGPTPEKIALTVAQDGRVTIGLRNQDSVPYQFSWRLELGGDVKTGRMLALPGQPLQLAANLDTRQIGFWESGFLRTGERQGRLFLRHEPDPSFDVRATETRDYPVSARLFYWSPTAQAIVNALAVLVVLLFGIALSLLINFALPMQRRRVAVKQRLAELDGRLGGIGSVISSRTLNLLRVEKRRLREEVRILWPIVPSTELALPELEKRIEALARRVDLTVGAGRLLKALEGDTGLARHEIDQATQLCGQVLRVVEKPAPSDEEFTREQAALEEAAVIRALREAKPTPDALQKLKVATEKVEQRANDAEKDPQFGATPTWTEFRKLLGGLRALFLAADVTECEREHYVDAANAVAKAKAILDYADLVRTAGSQAVHDGRLAFAQPLLEALQPGPGESATEARLLLQQAEENVSGAQIEQALRATAPAHLRIEIDPPSPHAYQLVMFRVHLGAPGLDNATARSLFRWRWRINGLDIPAGQDWTGWHFFEPPRTADWLRAVWQRPADDAASAVAYTVTAEALDPAAPEKSIVKLSAEPLKLESTKSYVESSTLLALGSLFVTVLIVGLGLQASAQEKLQTLDWTAGLMAIIAIGFGADVLKRALSKA